MGVCEGWAKGGPNFQVRGGLVAWRVYFWGGGRDWGL